MMMVLLSFSVKKEELLAGTKIRTTRLYTEAKWNQWEKVAYGDLTLDCYWKGRSKDGHKLFTRRGLDLYRLQFHYLNGHYWPFREWESGLYTPMTTDEFRQYIREEGFEGHPDELLKFFEDHYAPLEGKVFQSIAFPPAGIK